MSLGQKIAVLSCQGLINRGEQGGDVVFTLKEGWDLEWLDMALTNDPGLEVEHMSSDQFLQTICSTYSFPKIVYSKERHHEIIPQLITLAGVLSGVPLDTDTGLDSLGAWAEADTVFSADEVFGDNVSEFIATTYIFDNYGDQTTGKYRC